MRSPPTRSRIECATEVFPEPVPPATPSATRCGALMRGAPDETGRSQALGEERRLPQAEHLEVAGELAPVVRLVREEGQDHVLDRRGEAGDRMRHRDAEAILGNGRELARRLVGDRLPGHEARGE